MARSLPTVTPESAGQASTGQASASSQTLNHGGALGSIDEAAKQISRCATGWTWSLPARLSGCAGTLAAAQSVAAAVLVERSGTLGAVAASVLMASIGNLFLDGDTTPALRGLACDVMARAASPGAASHLCGSTEVPEVIINDEQSEVL